MIFTMPASSMNHLVTQNYKNKPSKSELPLIVQNIHRKWSHRKTKDSKSMSKKVNLAGKSPIKKLRKTYSIKHWLTIQKCSDRNQSLITVLKIKIFQVDKVWRILSPPSAQQLGLLSFANLFGTQNKKENRQKPS